MIKIVVLGVSVGFRAGATVTISYPARSCNLPGVLFVEVDLLSTVQPKGQLLRRESWLVQVKVHVSDDLTSSFV